MHAEAYDWVRQHADDNPMVALDIGGRNVNGTTRSFFPNAEWTVLDITAGEGVDIVADASTWEPDQAYDLILCTEVFEHTPVWRDIITTAYRACAPGGSLVLTMAGPGRADHSAVDGRELRPGEYYGNVDPDALRHELAAAGWAGVVVDFLGQSCDVRATARKPTD